MTTFGGAVVSCGKARWQERPLLSKWAQEHAAFEAYVNVLAGEARRQQRPLLSKWVRARAAFEACG